MSSTLFAVAIGMALFCGTQAVAQNALTLEAKIPLGDVRGRIDHMAVDLTRQRLFIAELENDTVAVLDIRQRKITHVITDVSQPQGLAYLPFTDSLFVASGGDGTLRIFQGEHYRAVASINLGEDVDNIRVGAKNQVFVSYGNGGFAFINALTLQKVGEIQLGAHPQGFQLDEESERIYANVPKEQAVVVLDYARRNLVAKWETKSPSNFPLALHKPGRHVLVAFRDPPNLAAFAFDGTQVASAETCGDADDMFIDARRNHIYISCGEGFLDVFAATGYQRIAHIPTVKGARTSLFVPQIDRLFVAARSSPEQPAAILVFRPDP
jgi:DNA-binding beta-propeller fold protein YncE